MHPDLAQRILAFDLGALVPARSKQKEPLKMRRVSARRAAFLRDAHVVLAPCHEIAVRAGRRVPISALLCLLASFGSVACGTQQLTEGAAEAGAPSLPISSVGAVGAGDLSSGESGQGGGGAASAATDEQPSGAYSTAGLAPITWGVTPIYFGEVSGSEVFGYPIDETYNCISSSLDVAAQCAADSMRYSGQPWPVFAQCPVGGTPISSYCNPVDYACTIVLVASFYEAEPPTLNYWCGVPGPFVISVPPGTPSFCDTGYIDSTGCTTPPTTTQAGADKPSDPYTPTSNCPPIGMCQPSADKLEASLHINDIPIGYRPQKGPDVHIQVTYNHLDTTQPTSPNYGNLGPSFTHGFLSYIQDDPAHVGSSVTRLAMGGGLVDYALETTGFNGSTGAWGAELQGAAVLTRIPASGTLTSYTLTMPDGSMQTFGQLDGSSSFPRRVFLTGLTDAHGNALSLSYDGSKRLTTIVDAEGRSTTFNYSGTSLLIQGITDPFGRSAGFSYDGYGRLASIRDVLGITSSFTYDATPAAADAGTDAGAEGDGGPITIVGDPTFIAKLTTPYGISSFAGGSDYGAQSRWLEMTDANGNTERVEYNQTNSSIGATESSTPSGMVVENGAYNQYNTFYWDKYVWPIYGTGPGKDYTKAEITHWARNNAGLPSPIVASIKRPLENRVYYTYPGQNTYPGQPVPQLVGTYDQPAAVGRVLDDGTSQVSTFTYNSLGFPLTAVDPLDRTTVYTYAPNNIDLVTVQQATSATQTYATLATYNTYNDLHEPLTYIDAAGRVWNYEYNSAGQLTSFIDTFDDTGFNPKQMTYNYDSTGRLTSIVNFLGNTQQSLSYPPTCGGSSHINCDLPASITDSEGRTVNYTRDALDRVTATTYPDGTTDLDDFTFQSGPNEGTPSLEVRKHTDRLGRLTSHAFDPARRLTSVTDPLLHTVQYGYFADGTLQTLTDQNDHTTTWAIDVQSRPTSKIFADNTATGYGYENTTSRLKSVTDALGQVKTYAYDEANELTGIKYTGAVNPTPNVSFSWDPYFPRRTGMTDGNGATSWTYVPPGTLSSPSNGALSVLAEDGSFANDQMTYGYDTDGRINSLTVGGGPVETWARDPLARVTSHVTGQGTWTYAFLGQTMQPASRTLGTTGISTSWSYDTNANDRRLIGITNVAAGAIPAPRSYTFRYAVAADGGGPQNPYDIMASTQGAGGNGSWPSQSWAYAYDNLDRLTKATGSTVGAYSYGLDGPGNLTTWTPTGAEATSSPTYNSLNELTSYAYDGDGEETADGTRTYKYDAENRVVEIDRTGTTHKTTIAYDGLGRRVQLGYFNGSTTTAARFAWCNGQLCQQRDGSDNVQARFYPEGEYWLGGSAQLVYMPDQLGSIRDVVNVSGPSVVYSEDFTPYGNPASTSGSTVPVFGFGGLVADANSGLGFSASRLYDPGSGRWIHRDPLSETGGLDLFAYAGGNPVSRVDQTGLAPSNFVISPAHEAGVAMANGDYGLAIMYDLKALGQGAGVIAGVASAPVIAGVGATFGAGLAYVEGGDPLMGATSGATAGPLGGIGRSLLGNALAAASGVVAYNTGVGNAWSDNLGSATIIGLLAPIISGEAFAEGAVALATSIRTGGAASFLQLLWDSAGPTSKGGVSNNVAAPPQTSETCP